MGEKIEEKEAKTKIDEVSSEETLEFSPDVCKTPSPAGPIPIPYPNIAKSSDTPSGSKKVKTEGKMSSIKEDFEMSVGDEAGTDKESKTGIIDVISKTKVLGISLWIWGLLIVAVIVVLWILSLSHPTEPLEYLGMLKKT